MTYEQALEFIHSRIHIGTRKGLDRMRLLMQKLGDPQKQLHFIHIAGSNGKGSTAAMCESILRHAGYRTGLFVSPYVFDFRERIQVDGQLVEKELMCRQLEEMLPALEEMKALGMECTEFEVVTALAIKVFAASGCDLVAFEVGIGGALDCTNVIDAPEVAVITSVSLEHTDILGHTVSEIAAQKCGIIKQGSNVAAYCDLHADALEQVQLACSRFGIAPQIADRSLLQVLEMTPEGSKICYGGMEYHIALAGMHQVYNALTAIMTIGALRQRGYAVPLDAIRQGLEQVSFVGRLQILRQQPLCIIDGAHNPEKIRSLCKSLDALFADRKLIVVMGMLQTKDYASCIPQLAQRSTQFIAVTPDAPKALAAEETAAIAREYCGQVHVCPDPQQGGALAVQLADEDSVVLACGSLYMIGEAKKGFLATN